MGREVSRKFHRSIAAHAEFLHDVRYGHESAVAVIKYFFPVPNISAFIEIHSWHVDSPFGQNFSAVLRTLEHRSTPVYAVSRIIPDKVFLAVFI